MKKDCSYYFNNNAIELMAQIANYPFLISTLQHWLVLKKTHLRFVSAWIFMSYAGRTQHLTAVLGNILGTLIPIIDGLLIYICSRDVRALTIFNLCRLFIKGKLEKIKAVLA